MLDNIVYIQNREWEDILLLEKENEKRKISEKKSELLRILQKKEELRITGTKHRMGEKESTTVEKI